MSAMSVVVGELGPTNTGKTHRAVERMLEHRSGMLGLPLRLLAREVYDRVTAKLGEGRVALMTGEEKRVPKGAAYWICTVEAMPTAEPVEFLAVDEIQLCAHRERGHVFTDRLLHARGTAETWFLGSETLRPLLRQLIPGAQLRRSERLSQLRYSGRRSLKGLPPRSATIAFSAERVYELAEALRRLRGGVAVVLGALSPRTRNAQVAMYQSGEVQYLVATDAIGMGLNLDLDHVAFAGLSKFDGHEQRELMPDELAQIAGRAGRHLNDGTFGTLNPLGELDPRTVGAIEAHRFAPIRTLVWRNDALDFTSPEALLDSLAAPPSHPAFARVERADDFDTLRALTQLPEVRERAADRAGVELLWQVCQVPDFRKRLFGEHVSALRQTFLQLSGGGGQLDEQWLAEQVNPLADVSGDLHVLTDRLAGIRIWTYISQKSSWLKDPERWQARTREIEDALSDALHARLVERFVEKAARRAPRRFVKASAAPPAAPASASPFAQLRTLLAQPERGGELTEEQFVQELVDAPHEEFEVDALGRIAFQGEPLARLTRGTDRRAPQVALADSDAWSAGGRQRVQRRLLALTHDLVAEASGGFTGAAFGESPALRGFAYQLAEGLGVARREAALPQWLLLDPRSRERLRAQGVREGRRFFTVAQALTPSALQRRALLTALVDQLPVPAEVPREAVVARAALAGREPLLLGYEPFGPVALRVDVAERLAELLADPRGLRAAQALLRELEVEGGLASRLLRELGPGGDQRAPPRRRRRRPRRSASS